MRYQSLTGLILKKQNRGENDSFLTVFSPELGKFNALGKSTRKIMSSKGSHLETLNFCHLQIYKLGQQNIITECRTQKSFLKIKNDLKKALYAQTVLEIINKGTDGQEQAAEIFELLISTLNLLELDGQEDFTLEKFKIRLLNLQGSLPEIAYCFYCTKKWLIDQNASLDQLGNLSCQDCVHLSEHKFIPVNFRIIKLIHFLCNTRQSDLNLKITPEELFQLRQVTNLFLQNYLHQDIKTEKLLQV
ncbi:MAG: DNA repair protein RecO [Candidatus Altimarinota bacterium]